MRLIKLGEDYGFKKSKTVDKISKKSHIDKERTSTTCFLNNS